MSTQTYLENIKREYVTGQSGEHSYRPALKDYIESLIPDVHATNEPKRQKCGAPDYIISKTSRGNQIDVGYIEAKDIGVSLDKTEQSEQMQRYLESLDNLILTDYIEFRFFKYGQKVVQISIAEITDKQIIPLPDNAEQLETLLKDFAAFQGQTIKSAKRLAEMMAGKARLMRDVFYKAVTDEEHNSIQDQYAAFKQVLIHDMSEEDFADIYAQTITYGLFTARLHDTTPENFSREESYSLMPRNNPFLRKLFYYVATELDDSVVWVVDALCEVYLATNIRNILNDFGKSTGRKDPVVHFYEDFLDLYDKDTKVKRGVWYTPEAVVNFIIRAVDDVLKKYFNLPDGIADTTKITIKREITDNSLKKGRRKIEESVHKVQLLDVASGTGTFIAEVIKQIYHSRFKGQAGIWSTYIDEHLLPRLHGFEILMASYAICHMKIDLLLKETGYKSKNESTPKRLGVYLTNSLEEGDADSDVPLLAFMRELTNESLEASRVKRDIPVMVAFGNPPYNVSSQNKGEWITSLTADYKKDLNERNINPLSDDYIKFIRYAEHYIEKNGYGVVAMITNNSFYDGVIHRQMRKHLLETFDTIYVYDLHGNAKKQEKAPDGKPDKNVFNIMQGVGITLFIKHKPANKELAEVWHTDILASNKKEKLDRLFEQDIHNIAFTRLEYKEPYYFFVPKNFAEEEKYNQGFRLSELFQESGSGVKFRKDNLLIKPHFQESNVHEMISDMSNLGKNDILSKYNISETNDWKIEEQRKNFTVQKDTDIKKVLYRPFDFRYTYYPYDAINKIIPRGDSRRNLMQNLFLGDNLSLIVTRQLSTFDFQHLVVSKDIVDMCALSSQTKETGYCLPLYLYPVESEQSNLLNDKTDGRKPNLDMKIVNKITKGIGLTFIPDNEASDARKPGTYTPLDLLDYIYAVLHSPAYREKYKEFLKIDFPRVPYPDNAETFWQLADLGGQLRALHLMESPTLSQLITTYPVAGNDTVDKINTKSYRDGKVYINVEQYFDNVPEAAWNFYIGGYQPAQKWLKDRAGRKLSFDDIMHYRKIIKALVETDRIMGEIDAVQCEEEKERVKQSVV